MPVTEEEKTVELKEDYAVIEGFPETVIDLTVEAEVYQDGEIQKYQKHMDLNDLTEALQDTRDGYVPGIDQWDWDDADNYEPPPDCIVLSIPENTVAVTLTGKNYPETGLEEFYKRLGIAEIRRAIQMAEEDFIPSDAKFVLTEKGKQCAEELLKKYE